MLTIERIDKDKRKRVMNILESDVVRHVFAYYDIQHDFDHTTMHAAFEDGELKGYVLIYSAADVLSVVVEGEVDAANQLIEYAPEDHFIMHVPPNLLKTVKREYPKAAPYVENWMMIKKGKAKSFTSKFVHKLSSENDALELAKLLSSRKDRPKRTLKRYAEWISKMPLYGVFIRDKLVSYAGSFIQMPQVWMIGGVYTQPKHRNKGYSTLAMSAITEKALENADAAALFVRSDNYPAIRVYEKIGYRKIGEKIWVDVGTGMKP
jgi:RimJ/RimL family protein N-acetyltransferase